MDNSFPPLEDGKSNLQLTAEVLGQFGAGYLTLTEVFRAIIPPADGYQAPIGDGTAIYFFLQQQPNFRAKCDDLANRITFMLRRQLGFPDEQGQLDTSDASKDLPIKDKSA